MPRAGECVGHGLDGVAAVQFLVQDFLELAAHEIFDLVGIVGIHAHHAQIVADQRSGVVVVEDFGKMLEGRTFLGFFDVGFERHGAALVGEAGEKEEQRKQFGVVGFFVFLAFEDHAEAGEGMFHAGHGVGHHEGADGGTQDGEQFEGHGFQKRADGAAAGHEAAEDAGQQKYQATYGQHGGGISARSLEPCAPGG